MDRSKTAPLVLLVWALLFTAWSVVLLATSGGSRSIEWLQFAVSLATLVYAIMALRSDELRHNRRIRYLLLAFAVIGAVMVLGLGADQDSSRTYARLGWAGLAAGFVGALIVWARFGQHRPTVIAGAIPGAIIIASGAGIAANCDVTVQRSWCDPLYEKEQALAERISVDGDLVRSGRAGGSQGAALVAFLIGDSQIPEITEPPGEWQYEERPLQSIEVQRGRYTSTAEDTADCRIDIKVEVLPAGNVETIYVTCGLET